MASEVFICNTIEEALRFFFAVFAIVTALSTDINVNVEEILV